MTCRNFYEAVRKPILALAEEIAISALMPQRQEQSPVQPDDPPASGGGRVAAALLFAQLLLAMIAAEMLIRILPFRRYAPLLRRMRGEVPTPPALAARIRRLTLRAGDWLPWEAKCLVRCIAVRAVLGARGFASDLSLGLDIDAPDLAAHAWLQAGGIVVSGAEEMRKFREVTRV